MLAICRGPAGGIATTVGAVRGIRRETGKAVTQLFSKTNFGPFRYFRTRPEIIHLAVMMYIRFPLSLRNVDDICTSAASISPRNDPLLVE